MKNHKQTVELVGKFVSTMYYIIKKLKNEETITNKHSTDWLKTDREEKIIIHEIKKDQNISATEVVEMIPSNFRKDVQPEFYVAWFYSTMNFIVEFQNRKHSLTRRIEPIV